MFPKAIYNNTKLLMVENAKINSYEWTKLCNYQGKWAYSSQKHNQNKSVRTTDAGVGAESWI